MADPLNSRTPGTSGAPDPRPGPAAGQPRPGSDTPSARPAARGAAKGGKIAIQAPKGTRDLYPDDANLRRYITDAWRNTSIRHGFEEIDGPTFEDADLYKVKSGEGILAEMFGVFSGKSPEDVAQVRETGEAPLVLRPEFTPTLARMYAARAAQLGKPTKWFTAGPFFRAERPQRGRLREFLQWNVDFIGLPGEARQIAEGAERDAEVAEAKARADAECIACCIGLLSELGLTPSDVRVKLADRNIHADLGRSAGVRDEQLADWFDYLDGSTKRTDGENRQFLRSKGIPESVPDVLAARIERYKSLGPTAMNSLQQGIAGETDASIRTHFLTIRELANLGVLDWCDGLCMTIVRGLAYYTGMVFEVIADGERAVAGGGRYDNLIELFGGPPTPAVGFGMGDVVLANLLRDKGLLPQGPAMLDALAAPPASPRPDAFVLTADEALDPIVRRLVADLRRGSTANVDTPPKGGMAVARHSHADSPDAADPKHGRAEPQPCHTRDHAFGACRPLHARHPYKSTRNVGKLLKDAAAQHARFAVIIENPRDATIKDMATGRQHWCPIESVPAWLSGAIRVGSA